jgi:hypothetical protein
MCYDYFSPKTDNRYVDNGHADAEGVDARVVEVVA